MTTRQGATLPDQSLAAIVLDAGREPRVSQRSTPRAGRLARESLAAIVLGASVGSARARVGVAFAATLFVYGGLGFAVLTRAARPDEARSLARAPLQVEHVVELPPEPEPEPEPRNAPPPEPPPAPPRASKISAPALAKPSEPNDPPPPAEAGQAVAAEPVPSLDFTSFDIATGRGQRYAGGVTAAAGSNPRAVAGVTAADSRGQLPGSGLSRARAVGAPRNPDWGCPWPQEAAGLALDEQIVVLRAVVRGDGSVSSVSLLSDPGFGFGPVAIACARRQQFQPARDEQGRAISATSPPIRFRFTRATTR